MHRVHRAMLAALLLWVAPRVPADDAPLAWANGLRGTAIAPLRQDASLVEAAGCYAAELAAAGVMSHAGPADGSGPRDRFFRAGGTAFEVGEILGAGPDLAAVQLAWEASAGHRKVVLNERYTHVGWGCAIRGAQQVWVLMFSRTAVEDLRLEERDGALAVSGRLGPPWAAEPWLDAGTGPLASLAWDPATRRFAYRIPLVDGRARFLLGCRDPFGDRQATDSVTWPRGTASRAGADRCEAPVRPP